MRIVDALKQRLVVAAGFVVFSIVAVAFAPGGAACLGCIEMEKASCIIDGKLTEKACDSATPGCKGKT